MSKGTKSVYLGILASLGIYFGSSVFKVMVAEVGIIPSLARLSI